MQMNMTGYGAAQARRQATIQRTRRFAFVGAALAAAALLIATTVTFTAQNATVSGISITGGTSSVIVTSTASGATGDTETPTRWVVGATTTATAPAWSPVVGEPVSIAADGDLILIDARGKANTDKVSVTVALQNAASLEYSTFILPIQMRAATAVGATTTWAGTAATGGETQYLTLTSPVVTFQVDGDALYEVMVPGASSNGLAVANGTTTLAPAFLVQTN